MAIRLKAMGQARYANGFDVTLHEEALSDPSKWKRPRLVFVNSMSDLFHERVPEDFIARVFDTMLRCPQHTFQVLTKRSKRLLDLGSRLTWPPNVWMGVSVEDSRVVHRILDLQNVPARVRFLSCEPLLGPLDGLPLNRIHWVIVGGESGPHARPIKLEWVEAILKECQLQAVPFFFKQWGGVRKDLTGRLLHGRTYDEIPRKSSEGLGVDDRTALSAP
jgi:protein gp37